MAGMTEWLDDAGWRDSYIYKLKVEFYKARADAKRFSMIGVLNYQEPPTSLDLGPFLADALALGSWSITMECLPGGNVEINEKEWVGLEWIINNHRHELRNGDKLKFTLVPTGQVADVKKDYRYDTAGKPAYIVVIKPDDIRPQSCLGTGMFVVEVECAMLEDIKYRQYMSAGTQYERMSLFERQLRAGLKVFDECGFGTALRGILTGKPDQSLPLEIQYGGIRFSKEDDLKRVEAQIKKVEGELQILYAVPTSEFGALEAMAVMRASAGMDKDLQMLKERRIALLTPITQELLDDIKGQINKAEVKNPCAEIGMDPEPREPVDIWAEAMKVSEGMVDRWHWKWVSVNYE